MRDRVQAARRSRYLKAIRCSDDCDHQVAKVWAVRGSRAVEVIPSGECFLLKDSFVVTVRCGEHGERDLPLRWLQDAWDMLSRRPGLPQFG